MSILPNEPWQDLACDFYSASSITLLVIIDEYSRYPIIHYVSSTAANVVIPQLHSTFATLGNPVHLNTDNESNMIDSVISWALKDDSQHPIGLVETANVNDLCQI